MNKEALKTFCIYKNHIIPVHTKKPCQNLMNFFMKKQKEPNKTKAKLKFKFLGLKAQNLLQKQYQEDKQFLSFQLLKHNNLYIKPFQKCPDFHNMLFKYAIQKSKYLIKKKDPKSDLFILTKQQFKMIQKLILKQNEINNQKAFELSEHTKQAHQQYQTQQYLKLLYEVCMKLYPYQKKQIYRKFDQEYNMFLNKQIFILDQISKNNIYYIKPFLFNSPAELYQSNHPQNTIQQCQQQLNNDLERRLQVFKQFKHLIQLKKAQLLFVKKLYNIPHKQIYKYYKRIEKNNSLLFKQH